MADLVALIIGIAHYPDLPDSWHVEGDRTVTDAIEVTRALVACGAEPKRIKLLLSAKGNVPADVAGVQPGEASKQALERFIRKELGQEPFVASRFLMFCSGHGAAGKEEAETLIITPDSFAAQGKRVFNCLGIEQLRVELQGMADFAEQIFCINACRTPAEWAISADDKIEKVAMLGRPRAGKVQQARFFAADELEPAPVQGGAKSFSNGFAEAVVNCLTPDKWPPRAFDWQLRLHHEWPGTKSDGIHGPDRFLFKQLYGKLHDIDRKRQFGLAKSAFEHARGWNERANEPAELWRRTLIDLHACTTDRLDLLMTRLQKTIFTGDLVPGGVQRADRWPSRKLEAKRREKDLIGELTYCLVEDRELADPAKIARAVADWAPGVRVVYVEIDGPCGAEDEALVRAMLQFWQNLIAAAVKLGTQVPCLPLLLVGHVDPEPRAPDALDATRFYHPDTLSESHERRLNLVAAEHLTMWLNPIVPDGDLRRPGLEREIARALGGRVLEDIVGERMGRIIEIVAERTS